MSRGLLLIVAVALPGALVALVALVFEELFDRYGLPKAIVLCAAGVWLYRARAHVAHD